MTERDTDLDDWDDDDDACCVNPECCWFGDPYDALFGICPVCESDVIITAARQQGGLFGESEGAKR